MIIHKIFIFCFLEYEIALSKLLKLLQDIGVDWKDRRLMTVLYLGQSAIIRVMWVLEEPYAMSFNIYT